MQDVRLDLEGIHEGVLCGLDSTPAAAQALQNDAAKYSVLLLQYLRGFIAAHRAELQQRHTSVLRLHEAITKAVYRLTWESRVLEAYAGHQRTGVVMVGLC